MSDFGLEVTYQDFPDGLRCAECHRVIDWGDRYSERFEGFMETNLLPGEDVFEVSLICLDCALKPDVVPTVHTHSTLCAVNSTTHGPCTCKPLEADRG